jgi:predicted nicotinamide N-methyase
VATLPGPLPLRHHAAAPNSRLSDLSDGPPYWAYLWPGGAALITHLAANPALVAGKRVLDLGAGSGLVGIAAAKFGAEVTASEIDRVAREVIVLNAALNNVTLSLTGDLLSAPPPAVDLILIGDLFYAPGLAAQVLAFLTRCIGIAALIGDLGRANLPRHRFQTVALYPVRDVGETATTPLHTGHVLQFLG